MDALTDELLGYFNVPTVNIDDMLFYWDSEKHSGKWPYLADLALNILSTPGTYFIAVLTSAALTYTIYSNLQRISVPVL